MLGCKLGLVIIVAQQIVGQYPPVYIPEYRWYNGRDKTLPCDSPLLAGWGDRNDNIFIGRAWYAGNLLPAKVMPVLGSALVGLDGVQYRNKTYQVLCGKTASWAPAKNGLVPMNALPVGKNLEGDILFYGRAHFRNGLHSGKINPGQNGLVIPYHNKEYVVKNYEVLVLKRPCVFDEELDRLT